MLPLAPAPLSLATLAVRAHRARTLRHGEAHGRIKRLELALDIDEPVRVGLR